MKLSGSLSIQALLGMQNLRLRKGVSITVPEESNSARSSTLLNHSNCQTKQHCLKARSHVCLVHLLPLEDKKTKLFDLLKAKF